jgi:hypothetical protein
MSFLFRLFKIAKLAAICKMSGCVTTDILLPFSSELAGREIIRGHMKEYEKDIK